MAKKLIVFLAIGVVAVASVFASHSISATVTPYSFQRITYSPTDHIDSTYGWGGQAGYRYTFENLIKIGADLSFISYKHSGYSRYLVLSLIPKFGFNFQLSDKLFLDIESGIGVDYRIGEKVSGFYPIVKTGLVAGYAINDKVSVLCGADVSLTFQNNKSGSFNSRDFDVIPRLGVEINF